jgi:hypothetical protein
MEPTAIGITATTRICWNCRAAVTSPHAGRSRPLPPHPGLRGRALSVPLTLRDVYGVRAVSGDAVMRHLDTLEATP